MPTSRGPLLAPPELWGSSLCECSPFSNPHLGFSFLKSDPLPHRRQLAGFQNLLLLSSVFFILVNYVCLFLKKYFPCHVSVVSKGNQEKSATFSQKPMLFNSQMQAHFSDEDTHAQRG